LSVDEDALKTAITNNVDAVADLFTDTENGIANKLKTACDKYVGTSGGDGLLISLAGKSTTLVDQSTLGKQISDYTSKIKDLNTKLSDEQDRLWSKFTTMEEQLSRLNAQATYLQNSSSNS
jgi:flagellar capping protein FliD